MTDDTTPDTPVSPALAGPALVGKTAEQYADDGLAGLNRFRFVLDAAMTSLRKSLDPERTATERAAFRHQAATQAAAMEGMVSDLLSAFVTIRAASGARSGIDDKTEAEDEADSPDREVAPA